MPGPASGAEAEQSWRPRFPPLRGARGGGHLRGRRTHFWPPDRGPRAAPWKLEVKPHRGGRRWPTCCAPLRPLVLARRRCLHRRAVHRPPGRGRLAPGQATAWGQTVLGPGRCRRFWLGSGRAGRVSRPPRPRKPPHRSSRKARPERRSRPVARTLRGPPCRRRAPTPRRRAAAARRRAAAASRCGRRTPSRWSSGVWASARCSTRGKQVAT